MSKEIWKRYRPKRLEDLVGQSKAVASLQKLVLANNMPHAILLTGPPGTGKTTIARILRRMMECGRADYQEIDCAVVESPLQTVRDLRRSTGFSPMEGNCKIYFLEEFQSLSRAGFSQQALLKLLEDVPEHVYYVLATTDTTKLNKAVVTRCSEVKLAAIGEKDLVNLMLSIAVTEKLKVAKDILEEIAAVAEGSARKALVILEQVAQVVGSEDQLKTIQASSFVKDDAIELCRELIFGRKSWPEVGLMLRKLEDQDPEGIRYLMLSYARSCLIGTKEGKAPNSAFLAKSSMVIGEFSRNFYDSKHAGLAAACYYIKTH